ncbi:TetR/AcrR family transcriptional regulator [Erwinia sp. B116]|uniref:TetR/AcrR family transcriptional regulator n=1 Tax=Erwinia sp. B116 TaxID=1561024 RepID=UPI000C7892CF|nr:TetR/AcrR family transcriptional regulator [Erwinia sp. B116]PLV63043.1 TetR family transcriptional regulator [Erwinia sp. B116]
MEQRDQANVLKLTSTRTRTRRLLIETAMRLFDSDVFPSITEVAQEAQLSRATAYRYFPTQSALVSAAMTEILGPITSWQPKSQDASARVDELLGFAFPRMLQHEGTLRAALHLSLSQWAQARSANPIPLKERLIRGNRKASLVQALEPLRKEMPAPLVERVLRALSLVYGSEIFLVMKDIWGCNNDELQDMSKWIANAILRQAREEAQVAAG